MVLILQAFLPQKEQSEEIQTSLFLRYKRNTIHKRCPVQVSSRSFLRLFNYLLCEFVQNRRQPTAFMIFLSTNTWDEKLLFIDGHFYKISCSLEGAKFGIIAETAST